MIAKKDRYYFNTKGQEPDVECTEKCPVLNNGVMIGSATCQECPNLIKSDADDWGCSWIFCQKLNDVVSAR
jgi:hypothetical protein